MSDAEVGCKESPLNPGPRGESRKVLGKLGIMVGVDFQLRLLPGFK